MATSQRYPSRFPVFPFRLLTLAVGLAGSVLCHAPAWSQTIPDAQTLIERFQQQGGMGQGQDLLTPPPGSSIQTYRPADRPLMIERPSRLEDLYSRRAGMNLRQFGYDALGVPMAVQVGQAGAVQDTYVLGQGDEIVVVLRGQENATYRQRVNRDGQVVLPRLPPVPAAGRTFGDFRADMEGQIGQAFISTNAFITLGEVRQVSVLVAGEVRTPGARVLSALASPLDAILLSGGVNKTGSLRNIIVEGANGRRTIDLYSVLTGMAAGDLGPLADGDRIIVPPLQNTVAVTGRVRRPGIYELRAEAIAARELLDLAGNIEIAGAYQFSKMELGADGRTTVVSLPDAGRVRNGEILFVDLTRSVTLGRVLLQGALQIDGARSLGSASRVGELIRGREDLAPDAYPMFSIIVRRDERSNARVLTPFSLEYVLSGQGDVPLQNDDLVYVFTRAEVNLLAKAGSGAELLPEEMGFPQGMTGAVPGGTAARPGDVPFSGATPGPNQPGPVDPGGTAAPTLGYPPVFPGASQNFSQMTPEQAAMASAMGQASQEGFRPSPYSGSFAGAGAYGAPYGVQGYGTPYGQWYGQPGYGPLGGVPGYNPLGSGPYGYAPYGTSNFPGPFSDTQRPPPDPLAPSRPRPTIRQMAETLGVSPQALVNAAKEHLVWVLDSVRDPGPYLSAPGSSLVSMIQVAGGSLREADLSSIEVTSTEINPAGGDARTRRSVYSSAGNDLMRVSVGPQDVIRLRPVFSDAEDGRIAVTGEVRYPGTFDIVRGERLSAILERAGGLTDQAYPYGAVFTRERAAITERESNAREADDLQRGIATVISTPSLAATAGAQVSYLSTLAQQLRDAPAIGRIVITADPVLLRTNPELDLTVEPGDTLYIPKRPTVVTVSGEVLNSGAQQYRADFTIDDYITLAGGTSQGADSGRVFIVLPDGSARPAGRNWLNFDEASLVPPGSTIVVPRDLTPFDTTQFMRDVTQILSQLAVAAASLVVIGQ